MKGTSPPNYGLTDLSSRHEELLASTFPILRRTELISKYDLLNGSNKIYLEDIESKLKMMVKMREVEIKEKLLAKRLYKLYKQFKSIKVVASMTDMPEKQIVDLLGKYYLPLRKQLDKTRQKIGNKEKERNLKKEFEKEKKKWEKEKEGT